MSFTQDQVGRAISNIRTQLKASGTSNIPYTKPEIVATMNFMKAVIDAPAYKTAQSNAIDNGLSGHTVSNSRKKLIHRVLLKAMLDEDLI